MADVEGDHNEHRRPKRGDLVIWEMDSEQLNPSYWVRTQSRGSHTQLFEGPDAWAQARSSAEQRAGPEGTIWKRHKDGHFELLARDSTTDGPSWTGA
jgi:hypothetical protein